MRKEGIQVEKLECGEEDEREENIAQLQGNTNTENTLESIKLLAGKAHNQISNRKQIQVQNRGK